MEDALLFGEADRTAYIGKIQEARKFWERAVASAIHADEKEVAASYQAVAALREAVFGNQREARKQVAAALRMSAGRDVQAGAGLALAIVGDSAHALSLANDLAKRFPEDTMVQFNYLPAIRAQLELNRDDPSKAIETLRVAEPYELGISGYNSIALPLYPVYLRGAAYLARQSGEEAVTEFQKILDHRGIVVSDAIGALAHRELGRAYAISGDTAKAKAAYQDFLTLWKDADPDILILKQSKTEYARLQ